MTFPLQLCSMLAILLVCAINFAPPTSGLVCSLCDDLMQFRVEVACNDAHADPLECEPLSGGTCFATISRSNQSWVERRGCLRSSNSIRCREYDRSEDHANGCCNNTDKCNDDIFASVFGSSSTVSPSGTTTTATIAATTTTISSTSTTNAVRTTSVEATPTKVIPGTVTSSTVSLSSTTTTTTTRSTSTTNAIKTATDIATPTSSEEATPTKGITEESEDGNDDDSRMMLVYFVTVLLTICIVVILVVIFVCVALVWHYKGVAYDTVLPSTTILESVLKEKAYQTNNSVSPV